MIIRILVEINLNMAHITTGLISTLMVFILVMQGNVSRTIPEGAINLIDDFECHTDHDCLENNTYCDVDLNLCSQCLNCSSMYFRTSKKYIKCPKDISDCSICLDGFLEEVFFGGEIRDLCVPIDSNIILPTPAKMSSNSYLEEAGIIFIVFNMILISVLWTYFYKHHWSTRSNNLSNNIQDDVENFPPSYHSCMKLDNYVTDDVQEFHLFTGEQPPRNEWRHQNAVPFRLPGDSIDSINFSFPDENENNEEINGTDLIREVEDPELHDEETMPSVWTPPPPPSSPEVLNDNNSQLSPPPLKRIRLVILPSDENNCQDEDNASDKSKDDSQDL